MCPELISLEAKSTAGRRLTDKLFLAFDQACIQGEFGVAQQLLRGLELIARRPAPEHDNRREESLLSAHERLWHLLHPNAELTMS